MANTLLTLQPIANEILRLLAHRELRGRRTTVFVTSIPSGYRQGDTVYLRAARDAVSLSPDSLVYDFSPVILAHRAGVNVLLPADALTLSIDSFSSRYIRALAAEVFLQVAHKWPAGAALVTAELAMDDPECVNAFDLDSGIAIQAALFYNPVMDASYLRADMLFGFFGGAKKRLTPLQAATIALLREAEAAYEAQREALRRAA